MDMTAGSRKGSRFPSEADVAHASAPPGSLLTQEHRTLQKKAAGDLRMRGIEVRELRMDPRKMLSWQRKNKLKNDQQGRSAYYAEAGRCAGLRLPEPS